MKKILIFFIFINNIISNNSFIYNNYNLMPIRYNLMPIRPNRNNLKILNNNIHYHIHYHMPNNTTNTGININTYILLIISIYNIIKDFNFILLNLGIFIIQILVFVKIKKLI
jgi:hypothetical protein